MSTWYGDEAIASLIQQYKFRWIIYKIRSVVCTIRLGCPSLIIFTLTHLRCRRQIASQDHHQHCSRFLLLQNKYKGLCIWTLLLRHWHRLLEQRSLTQLHFTSWMMASGVGDNCVMTRCHSSSLRPHPYSVVVPDRNLIVGKQNPVMQCGECWRKFFRRLIFCEIATIEDL